MSHESDQENKFDSVPFAGPLNNMGKDGVKQGKNPAADKSLHCLPVCLWAGLI